MTEKQIERIKNKITKFKKALANDKRTWGGYYHDGRGIRYLILAEYIKLGDFKGGLRYVNWFNKNFPDDSGYPVFLFEMTFILFQCQKLQQAEKKLKETYFSNTFLLDYFLEKKQQATTSTPNSNWEEESLLHGFPYSKSDEKFQEFSTWVEQAMRSEQFQNTLNEYQKINEALQHLPPGEKRSLLVDKLYELKRL